MSFDVLDDKREFVKAGLTGTVTKYTSVDMEYPCLRVVLSQELGLPKHKLRGLKNMFVNTTVDGVSKISDITPTITVYIQSTQGFVKAGRIVSTQVKSVLKMFEDCGVIDGCLKNGRVLNGKYLLTLSSF